MRSIEQVSESHSRPMPPRLSTEERAFLEQVIAKRKPELLHLLRFENLSELTENERDEIQDLVALELGDTGVSQGGEVNERGRALDALFGKLTTLEEDSDQ